MKNQKKFTLVYQGDIANVFEVEYLSFHPFRRNARRLYQGSFKEASSFVLGCKAAGGAVMTFACNQAGDITNSKWSVDLENQPFCYLFVIVDNVNEKVSVA